MPQIERWRRLGHHTAIRDVELADLGTKMFGVSY